MAQACPSRFVWFWTFWHWSKESFRGGSLLRSPLTGIGGHWDEWFRHEASVQDREAIDEIGRSESAQRQFIAWVLQHWFRDEFKDENRWIPRFVLSELGQLPPFSRWPSFARYRESYNVSGVSALVLAEDSAGEAEDVRVVEAIALPADEAAAPVVPEGFQIDGSELATPRKAALNLLGGQGLLVFVGLWLVSGRRPYPRWLDVVLRLGWVAVAVAIAGLLTGPDPGERLFVVSSVLFVGWSVLLLHALIAASALCLAAWREGRALKARLERSQVRLRLKGGLILKGSSAGLAFCLNTLQAIYRNHPVAKRKSWVWRRFFGQLESHGSLWAVTGAITENGRLNPVVLEPKIRACLRHAKIRYVFAPFQSAAKQRAIDKTAEPVHQNNLPAVSRTAISRLGFAADGQRLRIHRGLHVAQAIMSIGRFSSGWQSAVNGLALSVSVIMFIALPDLWSTLRPPLAPAVIAPGSPSPYYLWVSLETKQVGYFRVVLESGFWANRRADVKTYSGANASVRAELPLHRLDLPTTLDDEDGVIWIERRHRFLTRDFEWGERVGRYTVSYVAGIDHEE